MMTEEQSEAWRPEIPGWSSDILPYYEQIAEWLPFRGAAVEVGVAHGRSFAFMLEQRQMLGKSFLFYGVDMSPKPNALVNVRSATFTKASGIWSSTEGYIQGDSAKSADLFPDNSLDFVFIDAAHDYDSVKADITAWLPKLKSGGIISGHDHEPNEFAGVVQAVAEAFGGRHTMEARTVWQFKIPEHGDHG